MAAETTHLQRVSTSLYELSRAEFSRLEEAEEVFQQSSSWREAATLVNAVAAWHIADNQLWKRSYNSLEAYLVDSRQRLNCSRGYFYQMLQIADAFIRYQDALHKAGFRADQDASKLRFFSSARDRHGEAEALRQLPEMSYRDYRRWAQGELPEPEETPDDSDQALEFDGRALRYHGKTIVTRDRLRRMEERGERPEVVGIRSEAELRAARRAIREARGE